MSNPPWACLRKKDLGWDRGVESKKVVQHVYLVGAKSIYRVAEKDEEYLRDEEEKNQNTACAFLVIGIHTRQFLSVSDIADRLFYYDVSNYSVPFFYASSNVLLYVCSNHFRM